MNNRFFKSGKEVTAEIEAVIVGNIESQRQRSAKGNIIVKLPIGDKNNYPCLAGWKELTREEMLKDLEGDEWKTELTPKA